ncbi:copper amine oxidase N-terminal domain-containing protein [Paenibacillus protaetiae]|uniref:Copper amine oxidase-like N-terminal domain-containing protein n=1 Tax=Paenibacillus protaetiae TaxID=2509456 RepID=A0A4P6F236_9BACL|nr:copper amine oxidase N-terminal domain-containing protein [Paenibacillus protaetiae]QAY68209.1 hypothetical protein ET464_19355 [Paenibacillus protaetiae]
MKWSRTRKPIFFLFALVLVFVAGCKAVGGVDFNRVLKQSLEVTSAESNNTIELNLLVNEEASEYMSEEEADLLQLFAHTKLELDQVKQQDDSHVSLSGKLKFGTDLAAGIGFKAAVSDEKAVIEIEGAKHPFVLDMTGEALAELEGVSLAEGLGTAQAGDDQSITAIGDQLLDAVSGFAIDNLPNPKNLSVNSVNESINGVNTSLYHVHTELAGQEIWDWVKAYVDALAADKAGLNKLVNGIFEALASDPEVLAALGLPDPSGATQLDAPTQEDIVKSFSGSISDLLTNLQAELAQFESEQAESLGQLLGPETYVKADVYVDRKFDVRKENIELSVKPTGDVKDSLFPLDGLVLTVGSERWNVNGAVQADEPAAPDDAVTLDETDLDQGYKLLKQFDENSIAYDILKNKLHIGRQEVDLYADDYLPPIITPKGVTIIPLRDTAEQLGAEVKYDSKTQKIIVVDEATGTTIALTSGSDTVTVNGKNVKWQFPVTSVNGTTYVPARSFVSALGAGLHWESFYEDGSNDILVISREL